MRWWPTALPNTATLYEMATPAKSVQAQFVGKVPTVASAPLLTILKTVDSGPTIPAGDLVTFNINYQNVGGDAATNPEIRDVLPAGLSIESATGNPTISGNVIIWQTASLPAKQSTPQADCSRGQHHRGWHAIDQQCQHYVG